ncbi:MAG: hypothetical protein WDN69_29320 [Aliidongia sp.]
MFSANFRLAGQIEKPTITVNPLSPLAPGFLRRLFLFERADAGYRQAATRHGKVKGPAW